jgi:hypothetical protein
MQGPDSRRDGERAQPVGRKRGAFWGNVVLLLVQANFRCDCGWISDALVPDD